MPEKTKSQQKSLFPYRETLEQATEEAVSKLPITTKNELVSILEIQRNTVAHVASKRTPQ